jgi:hypothetical protein
VEDGQDVMVHLPAGTSVSIAACRHGAWWWDLAEMPPDRGSRSEERHKKGRPALTGFSARARRNPRCGPQTADKGERRGPGGVDPSVSTSKLRRCLRMPSRGPTEGRQPPMVYYGHAICPDCTSSIGWAGRPRGAGGAARREVGAAGALARSVRSAAGSVGQVQGLVSNFLPFVKH